MCMERRAVLWRAGHPLDEIGDALGGDWREGWVGGAIVFREVDVDGGGDPSRDEGWRSIGTSRLDAARGAAADYRTAGGTETDSRVCSERQARRATVGAQHQGGDGG